MPRSRPPATAAWHAEVSVEKVFYTLFPLGRLRRKAEPLGAPTEAFFRASEPPWGRVGRGRRQ